MLNFPAISMEDYLTRRGWQPKSERGGVLYGPCPIHQGENPNFVIYPDHFYCYVCKEQGDIIKLCQLLEFPGLDNRKQWQPVYLRVKELSGISPDDPCRYRPLAPAKAKEHPVATSEQRHVMTAAMSWWHECLHSMDGLDGYNWLTNAGILPSPRFPHVVGYAPRMTASLVKSFTTWMDKQIGPGWEPVAKETGILLEDGKHRNQSRVMFGCLDVLGEVAFYQGRTILDEKPNAPFKRAKYLGPPCIRKSGFWVPLALPRMIEGTCVVEGAKSVLVLGQHGIPAVAVLGSGVTAGLLHGFAHPLWILTDNDRGEVNKETGEVKPGPGQKLANRIIRLCEEERWPAYEQIVVPFEHNSPDVWVAKGGLDLLLYEIEELGGFALSNDSNSHQNVVELVV